MRRLAVVLVLAVPGFAQSFSLGVKGGVPLAGAFSTTQGGPVSYSSITRRYAFGPTVEVGLPVLGLHVEADALYRRIGWDSTRAATPLLEPFQSTVRIGAWDFDALLKHRVGGAGVHPYLGAGAAFRRFFSTRENYVFPGPPPRELSNQMIDGLRHKNIAGVVFSAGIEFGGALRIAPEFRYTRWLMNNIYDSFGVSTEANEADILLSLTFGRH